ncbi:hypothetical protein JCM8097_006910 [Rhodosporidiobolus ruineniae]
MAQVDFSAAADSPRNPPQGSLPLSASSAPSHRISPLTARDAAEPPPSTFPAIQKVTCRVRPSKRVYIPPPQFGLVEEGLFRSGQPGELNLPFVEQLRLKTVVWLAPEEPNPAFLDFIRKHRIELHHLGADDYAATYDPLSQQTVLQALNLILDPSNSPCAVMCNAGRHRTGTCIGVLRKLQRWNLTSILEEYRRYAGPKVRVINEQFIELFDVDLCVLNDPPADGGHDLA